MTPQPSPSVGTWYAGECGTGIFQVIRCDVSSGIIHLGAADGRRVRMTLAWWSRRPLKAAEGGREPVRGIDRFEWNEPVLG